MMKFKPIILGVFLIMSLIIAQPIVMGYEFTQETCSQGLTPDLNVKDSLILSAVTVCIPGMLEKINEYKQIKCQEVVCSYRALKNGLDPSFCTKQAGYKTCRYVTGEVFAMPGINFVEAIRDGIAQYLANPYLIVAKAARTSVNNCVGILCHGVVQGGSSILLAINDIAAFAQRISDLAEYGFEGVNAQENYCEDVGKIEKEVDSILEATNRGNE